MNEQDYIKFEAYLSESMTPEERSAFEKELTKNAKLKESFELYKEINGFLAQELSEDSQNFKENLASVSEAYFEKETLTQTPVRSLWKYAIAASIVIIFGVFVLDNFSAPNYNDYANYGEISLTVRSSEANLTKEAETAFNTKDFTKANDLFTELLHKDNANTEIQYYKAIANIELDNYAVADSLLETLSKGESAYKHNALWYLALSKLKQKKTEECIRLLKTIPSEFEYYDSAKKLLKKLQ